MGEPDSAMLDELVRGVLAVVKPLRIILFGSAARGEMTPMSNLDVMVVVPEGTGSERLQIAKALHRNAHVEKATDFVVVTTKQVEELADAHYTPIFFALTEGKELYRAAEA